jgi:putative oxidoreductase
MNADTLQTVWAPRVLSILRIVAALIFMEHGTQKLLGFPPLDRPAPEVMSLSWVAGVLELFGGALLVLGLSPARWRSCCPARWRSPIGSRTRHRASSPC